jgi:hypothetical protein
VCVSLGLLGFVCTAVGTLGISVRQISWVGDWIDQNIIWPYIEDKHAAGLNAVIKVRDAQQVLKHGEWGFEELLKIAEERPSIGYLSPVPAADDTYRIDLATDADGVEWVRAATTNDIRRLATAPQIGEFHDKRISNLADYYRDWSRYPFYGPLLVDVNLQGASFVWLDVGWCPSAWLPLLV